MIPFFHGVRAFLSGDGALLLPELELILFACGILLIDRWLAADEKHWNTALALAGTAFSGFTLYVLHGKMQVLRDANPESPGLLVIRQSILVDPFFLFFAVLFLAITVLIILFSSRTAQRWQSGAGSYQAMLLFGCVGMMLIASGVDVMAVFLGIEVAALSCYVLVRLGRNENAKRNYAALWVCSSAALALGFLLLFGLFKTSNLGRIGAVLDVRLDNGVAYGGLTTWHAWLALGLIAVGTFLLMEAAPLQWFVPCIYQMAPTPVAAYIGVAAKTAGFALLLRLFSFLFVFVHEKWIHVWGGVALASLVWGSVAAIRQKNVKRLLAYGSIAHTGFILLGLVAGNENGFHGMMYYVGVYVFSMAGVFGVFIVAEQGGAAISTLSDLAGLYERNRAAAVLLVFFLMSLAGIPGTAGFLAKYYLVKGLIQAPHPELAAFAVVCAVASMYYYGRVAAYTLKKPSDKSDIPEAAALTINSAETVALTTAAFVSLAAGLYPEPFLRMARYAFGQ